MNAPRPQPTRRALLFAGAAAAAHAAETPRLRPILVTVRVMFDPGAHAGKGLSEREIALFQKHQEKARREYATSGVHFDLVTVPGAHLRQQGYSEVPDTFLARRAINLFVTDTLGYDIDVDRTGGCSTGPRPWRGRFPGSRFYQSFLGLREAGENTLAHEYAHHFTLDTSRFATLARNFWADLRNNYWLWLQRQGMTIYAFRRCEKAEWARFE